MAWSVVVVLLVVAAIAAYVLAPVFRWRPGGNAGRLDLVAEREQHLRALREIELDFRTGKLGAEDYEALRRRHEAAAIAAQRALDRISAPV